MGGQGDAAERHLGPVVDDLVHPDRREAHRVAPEEVAAPAGLEQRRVRAAGIESGAGRPLQRRQRAGVVQVGVAVEQDPHPPRVEAQGAHIGQFLAREPFGAAVKQDQPVVGDDQVGPDLLGADIVEALGDLEWRDRDQPSLDGGGHGDRQARGA